MDEMNALLGRFHDSYLHAALYDFTDEGFQYMICYYLPKDFPLPPQFTTLCTGTHVGSLYNAGRGLYNGGVSPQNLERVVPHIRLRAGTRAGI